MNSLLLAFWVIGPVLGVTALYCEIMRGRTRLRVGSRQWGQHPPGDSATSCVDPQVYMTAAVGRCAWLCIDVDLAELPGLVALIGAGAVLAATTQRPISAAVLRLN
jgi:hypothetical protein